MKKSLAALGLALVFTGTAYAASWGYEGSHGPEHWGEFASECSKGQNQSPINIVSAAEAKLDKLQFDYHGKAISLLNNGHTLQTSLEGDNTLLIDGNAFTLKQFHFHTPSENHVDGKEYPLEAHFVHADTTGHLAVVAVFFQSGKANPDLAKLLANIPSKDQGVETEDHSTATQGWGRESGSTGQAFAGRMKGAIPEDAYFQKLESILEEKQRLDPKCWKGYKKSGTKMKGGVRVNNCVPAEGMAEDNKKPHPKTWHDVDAKLGKQVDKMRQAEKVKKGLAHPDTLKKKDVEEDWQKVNKQDKTDGMSRKAVKAYRRENPGSKLKTAVTTKPSKLKKGGKAAKRRKSFCARMSGMKKAHASTKTKRDPDSPINKALRRWNCHEDAYMNSLSVQVAEKLNPQADVDVWVQDFQKADPNKYHQFKNKYLL